MGFPSKYNGLTMKMVTFPSDGIILRIWIGWKWVIYLCDETKSAHFSSMIFGGENMFVIPVYKLIRTYMLLLDQMRFALIYSMASGRISNRIDTYAS